MIVQGIRDGYGGENMGRDYKLSKSIVLDFVDTDHDFELPEGAWDAPAGRIKKFILE